MAPIQALVTWLPPGARVVTEPWRGRWRCHNPGFPLEVGATEAEAVGKASGAAKREWLYQQWRAVPSSRNYPSSSIDYAAEAFERGVPWP